MQSGIAVQAGEFAAHLGSVVALPNTITDRKEIWLAISVRGPGEAVFTSLAPRQLLPTVNQVSIDALSCPHSHFTDLWAGSNSSWGLALVNDGVGDGLRVYSQATASNYAAVYASNTATTGSGTGVWAYSQMGAGIRGASASGHGVEGFSDSNFQHAGWFESANYAAAYLKAVKAEQYYAAVIDRHLHVLGFCTGCAVVYVGMNSGGLVVASGDLVAAAGVEVDSSTGQPVMQVRRAVDAGDAVIGVALGPAAGPSEDSALIQPKTPGKAGSDAVAPGEYLHIMVSGLAQVRVAGSQVAIGQHLIASANGAVASADSLTSVARVLSPPDANGLAWAMVTAR